MIGINPGHLSSYLGGTKRLTLDTLNRILSGIEYECTVTLVLHPKQTGQDANDADFTPLLETLSPEDRDMYMTDHSFHSE